MNDKVKPAGHTIYRDSEGTRVPGVTTVIDVLSKPQLITWANRMGLDGIDTTKYVDNLAEIGTLVHHLILCKFNDVTPDLSDFSDNQIELATGSVSSFYNWETVHSIEPILVETPLVSEELKVGGTPDLLCMLDDVPTLVDFKTGKGLYVEVVLQLAGYCIILQENGWYVEQARALRIGREATEGFEECIVTPEDLEAGAEGFMACLSLYNAMKNVRKHWKK